MSCGARGTMEDISRDFYELKFENSYIKKTSQEFEDFFSDIMEKRHVGGDFIRVRPWGNIGDRKNDGYLRSERRLYQVYAPNEMSAADAIKKINEDFEGALPYWEEYFDNWHFVHNARNGLSPVITERILALNSESEDINVLHFGFEELRQKFFELSEVDIISMVGRAPNSTSFSNLGFEQFKTLLGHLVVTDVSDDVDLRPVPVNKLQINKLSPHIESMIRFGLKKTPVVREFFNKWPDPNYGDQITKVINDQYVAFRDGGFSPDTIFMMLQDLVINNLERTAEVEASSLVLLSYFFEECDIFEREEG